MRAARSVAVPALLSIALAAVPAGSASAGGSWFAPQRDYYEVGDPALVRTSFGSGSYEGKLSDGPYFAYLVREHREFRTPGPIPQYAIPVGEISISRGNTWGMVARLRFTVPDVRSGGYTLTYCNDPCTVDGLGDLASGFPFFIGQTVEEARLLAEIERIELRLEGALSRARAVPRLKEEAAESEEQTARLDARLTSLVARVEELEARAGDLRSKLRAARTGANGSPDGSVAVLVVIALALAIALVVLAGRSISSRRSPPSSRPSPMPARIERVPSRGP